MTYHDSWIPPSPLSICPNCEIPTYLGDHRTDDGCFAALKQYVKLCQDEIENSRMRDFQHPTREELLEQIAYLAEQFDKFVIYVQSMQSHIADASRGKMVP